MPTTLASPPRSARLARSGFGLASRSGRLFQKGEAGEGGLEAGPCRPSPVIETAITLHDGTVVRSLAPVTERAPAISFRTPRGGGAPPPPGGGPRPPPPGGGAAGPGGGPTTLRVVPLPRFAGEDQ